MSPSPVDGLRAGVTAVSTGIASLCAVVNGALKCDGNLADMVGPYICKNNSKDSQGFVQFPGFTSGVTAISDFSVAFCAIRNGGVYWLDPALDDCAPHTVQGLTSGATAVSAVNASICAIVNGAVRCWGENALGHAR